jgi:serine/threonine protein kinase
MLYGKYPYQGISFPDILKKIRTTRPDFSGINISEKARDFIDRCLIVDPKSRIQWKEIYNHPVMQEREKIVYSLASRLTVTDNRHF